MDRQVEVVAGNHVVVRVAGALVVVAHRGRGRVGPDAPAMRAAEAVAQLVSEAADTAPTGPGRMIAREATRWLMQEAEQIDGSPIDLGILSRSDTGGIAIFLHGAVTAVLSGARGVEYYRGVDAAFTVDRFTEPPARAVAVFIDDERGRIPELPERGIGSLVEGVAAAAGAVVWFEGERSRARNRVVRTGPAGAHRRAELPPTSQLDAQRPEPQLPSPDTGAGHRAEAAGGPADDPRRTREQPPDAARPAEPADDPRLAQTQLRAATPGAGGPAQQSRPDQERPAATDARPSEAMADPRRAQTQLRGAPTSPESAAAEAAPDPRGAQPQRRGTNPAPGPDPELERRMEATARATSLTVRVMGFKCARAHPSDPRSAFCTVCGMPVDQTQPPTEVARPPLGMLVLDDGMTYLLASDAVIGRDPENSDAAQRGLLPVKIEDSSGGMSRAHAEIRLLNWDITVVDRGSTNGTRARPPGYREWIRLQPNQPMVLVQGSEIMLGNRVLRLDPAAPPPFG